MYLLSPKLGYFAGSAKRLSPKNIAWSHSFRPYNRRELQPEFQKACNFRVFRKSFDRAAGGAQGGNHQYRDR
jgi:hypothetical protein